MDIQIQSQNESALAVALQDAFKGDVSYKIEGNYPLLATHLVSVDPQNPPSGDPASKSMTFQLPRYGYLRNMVIESAITTAGNNNATMENVGERLFESIQLRSQGRIIAQMSDGYTVIRGKEANATKAMAHSRLVNASGTTFSAESITVYTPTYFAFFEAVKNHLALHFVEQLQLVCKFNDLGGMGLAAALTAATCKLWMEYYTLDTKADNENLSRNFKPSKPLNMLIYNTETEVTAITDSATSVTVDLKSNYLVRGIHFFVRDVATGVLNPITTYTIKASGRDLRTSIPDKISDWSSACLGVGSGVKVSFSTDAVVSNQETKPCSVYFGLEESRKFNSGALALNNVSNPTLTATFAAASTDELVVVYEYWSLYSIDSSSGVGNVGLST